jgi:Xaa-Pro aminopeptidase
MLADLDILMKERAIDVIVVPMDESMHSSFRWLTRGAKVTRGYAVKIAGRDPVLVTYPMERDEAASSGLAVRLVSEFDYERIFRSPQDHTEAYAELFGNILRDLGAGETVAFFGHVPVQLYIGVVEAMERRGWLVYRSNGEDLIQLARKRKEEWEVDAIRSVGERTAAIVERVRATLRSAVTHADHLTLDGEVLTLGSLKRLVSSEIVRLGMVEDHETILSQGRDAAVPHSRGDASAPVRPSLPIVMDIFPADRTTGYFFDMTRTFCVGPLPTELEMIHQQVYEAFALARDAVRPGTRASTYQSLVCDHFESLGYATTRSDAGTHSGYVHGLGHGVGLEVHERPSFHLSPVNQDLIEIGDVITIEPGLYFPERELGVRIEDTFVVREWGVEALCHSDYRLEP